MRSHGCPPVQSAPQPSAASGKIGPVWLSAHCTRPVAPIAHPTGAAGMRQFAQIDLPAHRHYRFEKQIRANPGGTMRMIWGAAGRAIRIHPFVCAKQPR